MKQTNPPDLENHAVHMWRLPLDLEEAKPQKYFELLSDREREKARQFKFIKDRVCYVLARGSLRLLLGNYIDVAPDQIDFEYSQYGKPRFCNTKEVDFNLSHSGNEIIIGFCKNMVIGVDIEQVKINFDIMDLAKNFFSNEEIKALSQFEEFERPQAFFRCWTRKESFIKAVGEGLSYPLDSFAVTMEDDEKASFLKIDNNDDSKKDWHLHSFVPAVGYIAAITTNGNPNKIEYFDANELLS